MRKHVVVLLALLAAGTAHASFVGGTVQANYYFPSFGTILDQRTGVVGAGVEFTNFPTSDPRTNVDFSATNIYITYNSAATWTTTAWNGPSFDALSGIPPISGVTINPATNMAGLDASRISFTPTSVSINWNGLGFNSGTIVSLDVTFGELPIPTLSRSAVAVLIVLIAGLGVLVLRRI